MTEIIKEPNRVYIMDDDQNIIAYCTFKDVKENTVELDHTFVDGSLRGMGIAGKLVKAAYEVIKEANKKVILTCSYAVTYFEKHPELNDILA